MNIVNALIVDGQFLSRVGLAALLRTELCVERVHASDSVADALAYLADNPATQLILLDLALEIPEAIGGIAGVRQRYPGAILVAMDSRRDRRSIFRALEAGAQGFIPRGLDEGQMRQALRVLSMGHIYVPPTVGEPAPVAQEAPIKGTELTARLTERQMEVLVHLSAGKSNKEIARTLLISESTVKVHVAAAFRLLGVHNRVGAAAMLQTGRAANIIGKAGDLRGQSNYGRRSGDLAAVKVAAR